MNRKPTKLPQKETTKISKVEKFGYKLANKIHKFAVLTLVTFIFGNIIWFGKQYNDYWKARRNPNLIYDMERRASLSGHNNKPSV